ncbi:RNA polymerase sigma factor [Singulisphaera acidiphila]|uniref:RNA polymerase sigma factor, sigma-70 family n=1 Tax=Singulisphaera acidiphila (strain ATCC BAA-1392 / DSM 18658 / VKM B-2454 / MOB10) TaxID=886293 RepID=L0DE85_SINAD|nr:sigma-70 family RNA polymerase sigma factor [Singulisphaera acidiphila]AGA27562.1 RNA polymerase sigma factor, sigma-70 family [Singulisphaera acidiphila DSM 18658]
MANGIGGAVLPQIQRIFHGGTLTGMTDGQLLARFATRNDEAAFEALLARHGPLVLHVCRNLLRDRGDVEDAFQATLLVLVRKAGAIHVETSLGPWIYSVAYRVANRARANREIRITRENPVADLDPQAPSEDLDGHDVSPLLHHELAQLPERLRAPIVLCYFQGLTHELAAAQLRWPVGTVRSRMARARRLLRERLTRKGVVLSAGFLVGASQQTTAAMIPRILSEETIQSAMRIAAGRAAMSGALSVPAAALMEGVLSAMWMTKLKTTAAVAIMAGFILTGVVALAVPAPDEKPGEPAPTNHTKTSQAKPTRHSSESTYPKPYYVGDLVVPPTVTTDGRAKASRSSGRPRTDYAPLIELLTSSVAPGRWTTQSNSMTAIAEPLRETGPIGSITPFHPNISLIIRHTAEVHDEIANRLRQLRKITNRQDPNSDPDANVPTKSANQGSDDQLTMIDPRTGVKFDFSSQVTGLLPAATSPDSPASPVAKHHRVQKLIKELEQEMDQLVTEHAALRAKAKISGVSPN